MTVNYYQKIDKTVDEIIEEHLRTEPLFLYSGVVANVKLGVQAVENNEIDEEHHRWRGDIIRGVLEQCAARGMFAQNGNYLRALDAVYSHYPRFARVSGNDRMIVHFALEKNVPFEAQALADMIAEQEVWDSLALAPQYVEQTQATRLREQRIREMTQGGSKPFSLRTGNLNSRTFDVGGREIQFSGSGGRRFIKDDQGFAAMADEQIQSMYDQWKQEQTYKSMSVEDLRKQVRQQGKEHFEQKFRGDPGSRQPATTPGNAVLIDPRNEQPITRRIDLIHYINSSSDALAKLVKPKGTTIRERALEVDRLLGARE